MKLRAYYITLHLQHKILYTFLFLLHSTFAANVWWCIHRRTQILELLLFLLCADLRNLYKVYSCTIIIQCYTSSNTADDETTMLVSLRSRIKTTCTNVWSCVLPLHTLVIFKITRFYYELLIYIISKYLSWYCYKTYICKLNGVINIQEL